MSELKMSKGGLFGSSNVDWYLGRDHHKLSKMKKHFVSAMTEMIKFERAECAKVHIDPQFTLDKSKKVASILEQIKDHYELEALRRVIFDLNIIPDTYEEIKRAGSLLREE